MRQGKRASSPPFVWPGTDASVGTFVLRVLTCTEQQEAHAAAYERLASLKLPPNETVNIGVFHDELATQVLSRACRDSKMPDREFFESAEVLRDHTTADERALVVDWFTAHQSAVDPAPGELSPELFGKILELVKKKDMTGLNAFGSSMLARFLLSSDSPPSTSPTGSS